jgi:hypothetical protein
MLVVRTVSVPASSAPMQRSVAACLASILELDVGEVPLPDEGHPEPWTVEAIRVGDAIAAR